MNSVPSVMMNDGSFVRTTSHPLMKPVVNASTSARPTPGSSDQPRPPASTGVTAIMIAIPEKPRIEPIDRSNSPAIISRATATARIPRGAARLRIEAVVAIPTKLLSAAMIAKKTQTTTNPAIAPSSGRPRSLREPSDPADPFVAVSAVGLGCRRRHRWSPLARSDARGSALAA